MYSHFIRRSNIANSYGSCGEISSKNFTLADGDSTEVVVIGFFGELGDYGYWSCGVLANGKIYGIPTQGTTQVLEIDPNTRTANLFGNTGSNSSWSHGILAPNGQIYGIPYSATQVLEINPFNHLIDLFGSLPSGLDKWSQGILVGSERIYGIPYRGTQVLKIDLRLKTASLIGSYLGSGYKWKKGFLMLDGKIYGLPYGVPQVLIIDPTNDTTTLVGNFINQYMGVDNPPRINHCVLAPDGKIYGVGESYCILEFDYQSQTGTIYSYFDYCYNNDIYFKTYYSFLDSNGKIYALPDEESTHILVFDTNDKSFSFLEVGDVASDQDWRSGVMLPNGKIYALPYYENPELLPATILVIDTNTQSVSTIGDLNKASGRFFDGTINGSYFSDAILVNNRIYGIPYGGSKVVEVSFH